MRYLISILMLFTVAVKASPVKRQFQDMKYPTQAAIERQVWTDPLLAVATRLSTAASGATSAAIATLSSFSAQPDQPRNIVITPAGTTTDIEACVIVVNGTNFFGAAISENFTFAANDTAAQTGAKAFQSVTSVVFPANCESGAFAATWNIGTGAKLGLKRCMNQAGDMFHGVVAGVKEGTAPTIVADADEIEKNTASFNTALDGSKDVDLFFVQNFRCFP
jgi:hypothetical protein